MAQNGKYWLEIYLDSYFDLYFHGFYQMLTALATIQVRTLPIIQVGTLPCVVATQLESDLKNLMLNLILKKLKQNITCRHDYLQATDTTLLFALVDLWPSVNVNSFKITIFDVGKSNFIMNKIKTNDLLS